MKVITKVVVSILNWNSAHETLNCIKSVLNSYKNNQIDLVIFVLDNGSTVADYEILHDGVDKNLVTLIRVEKNLGFAAGHNLIIRRAFDLQADFIWLLNSDALAAPDAVTKLVDDMLTHANCGVNSPVIVRMGNREIVDACGAMHHWQSFSSVTPQLEEAKHMQTTMPEKIWLVGTAVMFRVTALKDIGLLDERFFAYYEDDDIGVRLAKGNWRSRVVFDCFVEHACFDGVITDRKPYYFYLMARNSFIFFIDHTPAPYRKGILIRLINRSMFVAESLYDKGLSDKANACMLGISDGINHRYGAPDLNRSVPWWLKVLRPFAKFWNSRQITKV